MDVTGTTVLIGPNASGKSNLVMVVRLVMAVARAYAQRSTSGAYAENPVIDDISSSAREMRHHGFPEGEDAEARIGIELTTREERELLVTFFRACLASQLTQNNLNNSSEDCWSRVDELPDDVFRPFFRGDLVAAHSGVARSHWRLRFEPQGSLEQGSLVWDLYMNMGELRRDGAARQDQLPDLHTRLGLPSPAQHSPTAVALPESFDVSGFTLSQLVLGPPDRLATTVVLPGLRPEQTAPVVRRFLALSGASPSFAGHASIGAAFVWDRLLAQGIQVVDTETPLGYRDQAGVLQGVWHYSAEDLARPATLTTVDLARRLWELHNAGPEGAARLRRVQEHFHALAGGRKLVVAAKISSQPGGSLPAPLQLVTSGAPTQTRLAGESGVPVVAVPTNPSGGGVPATASLDVRLLVEEPSGRHLPITAVGRGVGQALVLGTALGDAQGKATVLDEPATNLHPEWQRLVRDRLDQASAVAAQEGADGAQFLVATHSPYIAAPSRTDGRHRAFPVRLRLENGATVAVPAPDDEVASTWPRSLAGSGEAWSLLFAAGVLLVEGSTETAALPIWFDKITKEQGQPPWAARDISVFSVGGQKNFRAWASFLHYYQVPFAICCDGQALDPWVAVKDGEKNFKGWQLSRDWVFLQLACASGEALSDEARALQPSDEAQAAARSEPVHPDVPTFEQVKDVAARLHIGTVANWFQKAEVPRSCLAPEKPVESIEDLIDNLIDNDPVLSAVKKQLADGRSPVQVGAEVASRCDPPEAVRELCSQVLAWLSGAQAEP